MSRWRRIATTLGGVGAACIGIPAWGAEVCEIAPPIVDGEIDAVVEARRAEQHIVGLTLGVVWDGEVVYLAGYGEADRRRATPASPTETLFRWASVSKTVTAVAAMAAVERGWLDLDQDVRQIDPSYVLPDDLLVEGWGGEPGVTLAEMPPDAVLTLRQLLGHQGGIQHYSNGLAQPTPPPWERNDPRVNTGFSWALERFTWAPLLDPPGVDYSYSTMGFDLAGAFIGAAWAAGARLDVPADEAFTDLVAQQIADPAGAPSLQPDYHWASIPGRAAGYVIASPTLTVPDTDTDVSWKLPGGGLMSTAEGMACYCRALSEGALLDPSSEDELWTRGTLADGTRTGYGLGFNVGSRDGRRRVSHNGQQEKANSRLSLYPDDGLCVVVLTNTRSFTDAVSVDLTSLANDVEDVVLARVEAGAPPVEGAPAPAWSAGIGARVQGRPGR